MALTGKAKAAWQRSYIRRPAVKAKRRSYQAAYMVEWRRADRLARQRIAKRHRIYARDLAASSRLKPAQAKAIKDMIAKERRRILG